jgi:hypothetical protein
MMQTNHGPVLPEPSILKKIDGLFPGAAETIFSRGEAISAARRLHEQRELQKPASFLKALFSPRPYLTASFGVAKSAYAAIIGDDIRQAIFEFMSENHVNPKYLDLTDAERRSLDYQLKGETSYARFELKL